MAVGASVQRPSEETSKPFLASEPAVIPSGPPINSAQPDKGKKAQIIITLAQRGEVIRNLVANSIINRTAC